VYLHDADDSDRCSATLSLLAELISVRDGLSDISYFLFYFYFYFFFSFFFGFDAGTVYNIVLNVTGSGGSMFAYDDVCDLFSHFALS